MPANSSNANLVPGPVSGRRAIFLLALLVSVGCASAAKNAATLEPPPSSSDARISSPAFYAEIQRPFAAGMLNLDLSLKKSPRQNKHEQQLLLDYMRYWKKLIWAELLSDGQIIARSSGEYGDGVLMIVAPNNPGLNTPGPTLSTSRARDYSVITIRPDRISEEWAAVFMMHELSHMGQFDQGRDLPTGESELMAYRLEKLTLSQLTNNHLDQFLDAALNRLKLNRHDQFIHILQADRGPLHVEIRRILELISAKQPASRSEEEMRAGFVIMALVLRIYERQGLISEKNQEILGKMIEEVLSQINKYPLKP